MSSDRRRFDGAFERLAAASDRYAGAVFYALALGYVTLALADARTYDPDARLFPVLVGVPLAVLLAVKLVLERSDGSGGAAGPLADVFEAVESHRDGGPDGPTRYRRYLAAVGWLSGLVVLVRLVGLFPAAVLYVTAFVYRQEGDLRRALALGGLTGASCYLLFARLLSATTYGGLLAEVL